MMEMRATDRGDEVLKERAAPAEVAVARRSRKDDIVGIGGANMSIWRGDGIVVAVKKDTVRRWL
jgi:O-glycosyl hydrolase